MTDVWLTLGLFLVEIVLAIRLLQIGYGSYKNEVVYQRREGNSGFVFPTGNIFLLGIVGVLLLGGASIITYDILTVSTDTESIAFSGIVPQEIGNVDIEIYADPFGTQALDNVEWGAVEPGTNVTVTGYVRNVGGDGFTANITTTNWLFDDSPPSGNQLDYFAVIWNFGDTTVTPGRQREVEFNLWVSENVIGITSFSFDIVITAIEA